MSIKGSCVLSSSLCFSVLVSGLILSSSYSFATDSIEDDVSISVPVACSLTSTLDNDHTSTIYNGTNTENIGTTTMQVFCNDAEGFAIYAAGYTGNEIGTETSNKLIGMNNQTPVGNISTGIATSGNTSNWSMKVTKVENEQGEDPVAYNPANLTIESDTEGSFSSYHTVPSEYTKVASFSSSTDVTLGSLLKTTYQAYISPTQPAGTYNGQVKYVLIHPSAGDPPVHDDQIGVIYHGNGLTFPGGANKNRVVYGKSCTGYVSNIPTILKSSNLNDDGTQNGPYANDYEENEDYAEEGIYEVMPFNGAIGIKVVVDYAITADSAGLYIAEGEWGNEIDRIDTYDETNDEYIDIAGTKTYMVTGGTVSIDAWLESWKENDIIVAPETDYDYGFYIRLYPIYAAERDNTTNIDLSDYIELSEMCFIETDVGAYNDVTIWDDPQYSENGYNYWYSEYGDVLYGLDEVHQLLYDNYDYLKGSTIDLYAANSYTVVFDANGGSGVMENQTLYPYVGSYLDGNTFTNNDLFFIGWNTKSNGTGTFYSSSDYIVEPINEARGGGSITLYAQWSDCAANYICYKDNGADDPTAMKNQVVYSWSNTPTMLWASNFQRQGYGFAGWNTKEDGTGRSFGPMETISDNNILNILRTSGLKLYAMWIESSGTFQNWTCPNNTTMPIGTVTALTDIRDNDTYAVAKLADGKCWMIENLRLDYDANITTSNTQSNNGSFGGVFNGLAKPESPSAFNTTTANSLYSIDGSTSITIPSSFAIVTFPRYNNQNTLSKTEGSNYPTNGDGNIYSYGNYYSWAAAVADTTRYGTVSSDANRSVKYTSLCPSGWRLPKGGDKSHEANNDFWALIVNSIIGQNPENYTDSINPTYTGKTEATNALNAIRAYPNNFIYSGWIALSRFQNRGIGGQYWTSTISNSNTSNSAFVLFMYMGGSNVPFLGPGVDASYRADPASIRCIFDN